MVEPFVITRARIFALFLALAVGIGILAVVPGTSAAQDSQSPPPEVVVLARSDNPADALGAGPVAGILGAPVLVTPTAMLLPNVAASIQAIDPDLVILAGGTAALSADVESAVNDLGYATRRAAGSDRHETAVQIAGLLAEYNTGRPLLSGTPISDQVIPGLNAEQLGGMTIADLLDAIDDAADDAVAEAVAAAQPEGEMLISLSATGWILSHSEDAEDVDFERNPSYTRITAPLAGMVVFNMPVTVPRTLYDQAVTVHGMELCYSATGTGTAIESVGLRVMGPSGTGFTQVAGVLDNTTRNDSGCRDYMLNDPHTLADQESIYIHAAADFGGAQIDLNAVTLIMSVDG